MFRGRKQKGDINDITSKFKLSNVKRNLCGIGAGLE